MKNLDQKYKVIIDLDLAEEEFDVSVVNMSSRKGFVDIEGLKSKLFDILKFLEVDGMAELTEQITKEQLN